MGLIHILGKEEMTMKKYFILCLTTIAVVASVSSCTKEIAAGPEKGECEKELNFVEMTFTTQAGEEISAGTRAQFGSNYPKIEWVKNDKVAVIGTNNPSTVCEFSALSSGESTTLSGKVVEGENQFVALYPYQSGVSYGLSGETKMINGVNLPSVQTAVKNGFDPQAFIFSSFTKGSTMTFFPAVALVKFKLNDKNATNIKSITLKANSYLDDKGVTQNVFLAFNNGSVQSSSTGSHFQWTSNQSTNGSTTIKLVPAIGEVFTSDTYYYFAVRSVLCKAGLSLCIEYNDGVIVGRSSSNAITPLKSQVLSLGEIKSSELSKLTYSEKYSFGYDVVVGDNVYNISTTPSYNILDATSAAVNLNTAAKSGLNFLKGDKFTLGTNWTNIANDIVLIGDTQGVKFSTKNDTKTYTITLNSNSFKIMNVELDVPNTNYLFVNNSTETDAETLVFDGCKISTACPLLYSYLKTGDRVENTCAVKNLILKDCNITLTGSANHIVNLGNAKASKIETVNISGCTITPSVAVAARVISLPDWVKGSTTAPSFVFNKNVLWSVIPSGQSIISFSGKMKSIEVKNNSGSFDVSKVADPSKPQYFINYSYRVEPIVYENNVFTIYRGGLFTSTFYLYPGQSMVDQY